VTIVFGVPPVEWFLLSLKISSLRRFFYICFLGVLVVE